MTTIGEVADALGRDEIVRVIPKIERPAVDAAVRRGKFPASWYVVVKELAASKGIDCPDSLFAMKGLSSNATEAAE